MAKFHYRSVRAIALVAAAVALAGCASMGGGTPEQVVQKRAEAYWKARLEGKYEAAYALSTPAYRKLRTAEQFSKQYGASVAAKAAEVTKVTCDAVRCETQVRLDVKPGIPGLNLPIVPMYVNEVWLLEDGQWWHFQES